MKYVCFIWITIIFVLSCTESAKILGVFPLPGKSVNILYNRLMKGLADAGHDVTIISSYKNTLPISNGSYTDVLLTDFAEEFEKSAKILGVFPTAGKSVNILYNRLMAELADAGHDVTVISAYKNKLPILNESYTDIHLTGFAEEYERGLDASDLLGIPEHFPIWAVTDMADMLFYLVNDTFAHPNVKKLLASDAKFDLVITELLWSESLLMFSHIYNCPSAVFTSMGGVNPWVNDMVGSFLPPSYVQHYFLLGDFSTGMPFLKRVHNYLFFSYEYIFKHYRSFPAHNEVLKRYFKDPPDLATLYHNVSLVLLGSHVSLRQATPLVPNVVDIGGFHIDSPKKLPQDLQEFLDNAKEGAIYFSMGSHVKSSFFSDERKKLFLNVFKKLKLKVLWKFEDDILPGKPSNVLIKKWVPQVDILGHPNVKLFISHGGYGSTLETIYHGVPTLSIPVFADQFNNANQAVGQGYALKLSYIDENFTEETVLFLIKEMLENPKYSENAKFRSKLFHDRPTKPLDTAIYWLEYVIRNKGADHLKVIGRTLPWYQYHSVDVILFLVSTIVLIIYTFYFILKTICKACGNIDNIKVKRS